MDIKIVVRGVDQFKDNPRVYRALKRFAEILPQMKWKSAAEHIREMESMPKTDWKKVKWFRYGEK